MTTSSREWPAATEPRIYSRHDIQIRTVVVTVASQVWPLLILLGLFLLAALAYLAQSGDRVPAEMAWTVFKPASLGLIASFALHESAHVVALKRIRTVTHIAIDRTRLRTSVIPKGVMTARQMAGVALVGPFSCVIVGSFLWLSGLDRSLAWWYLSHIMFLLPTFGDGRALRHGLRAAWRRPALEDRR